MNRFPCVALFLLCRLASFSGVKISLLLTFSISKESIIDVSATVKSVDVPVEGCSQKNVELHVKVSLSKPFRALWGLKCVCSSL